MSMKQFRLSEHTPDVYSRKSRDFQLFCAIFDCLFGQLKYDIDSIRDVTDTSQCNERLLPLLQTKLGFFTNAKIQGEDLRLILKAFPLIVHNKGSLTGIQYAVQVYLKIMGLDVDSDVNITNKTYGTTPAYESYKYYDSNGKMITSYYAPDNWGTNETTFYYDSSKTNKINFKQNGYLDDESYIVDISVKGKLTDTTILTEILRYVIPAGYKIRFSYKVGGNTITTISSTDKVDVYYPTPKSRETFSLVSSGLRPSKDSIDYPDMLGRVDTTFVSGKQTKQLNNVKENTKGSKIVSHEIETETK